MIFVKLHTTWPTASTTVYSGLIATFFPITAMVSYKIDIRYDTKVSFQNDNMVMILNETFEVYGQPYLFDISHHCSQEGKCNYR